MFRNCKSECWSLTYRRSVKGIKVITGSVTLYVIIVCFCAVIGTCLHWRFVSLKRGPGIFLT